MTTPKALPDRARVVIVGGGVIGVSIAFHLAEAGVTDLLLLEAHALGSGSTCKAAGGVRAQFSDRVNIELGMRSLEAFRSFGTRPGGQIDLHEAGYLFLLDDADTVAAFEQNIALQNEFGVPSRLVTPQEAAELSPLISTEGLLAAAFSPADGYCTPESVVLGYATAARALGARLITNTPVTGVTAAGADAFDVRAAGQVVRTETVICAAGAWSQQIGSWVGAYLPVTPLRRQIVVTEPIEGLPPFLPMTIDFGTSFYFHSEGLGLLVGMSDPEETPGFQLNRSDAWLPTAQRGHGPTRTPVVRLRHRLRLGRPLRGDPGPQRAAWGDESSRTIHVRDRVLGPRLPDGAGGRRGHPGPLPAPHARCGREPAGCRQIFG